MDIPGAEERATMGGGDRSLNASPVERVGSSEFKNESLRDGGAMRRVESLEQLAPELKHNSSSFESGGVEAVDSSGKKTTLEDDDAGPGALSPARDLPRTVSHNATIPGGPVFPATTLDLDSADGYEIHEGSAGPDEVQTPREQAMAPMRREESGSTSPDPKDLTMSQSEYNPQPQDNTNVVASQGTHGDRVVLVMVGLPARGKTYIARKVARYLTFFHGAPVQTFNVGEYRRKHGQITEHGADYFSTDNKGASAERERFAQAAMRDMKAFLTKDKSLGRVAIFDGTNTNVARRAWILSELKDVVGSKHNIIFVESICNDDDIINANIRATKLHSPDYRDCDAEQAVADFKRRIAHYEKVYEPLSDEGGPMSGKLARNDFSHRHLSWIKLIDCGRQVVVNRIKGFLQGRIVQFLMNVHTLPRTIYLSRHGQSEYNVLKKIGGNSSLSERGNVYAQSLALWVHQNVLKPSSDDDPHNSHSMYARLWTSSLNRTRLTGAYIMHEDIESSGWVTMRPREWRALDEIYAGVFDGMSYEEIEARFPAEFALRAADKLSYRYPRGESYLDVMQRLDPIVHELERQTDPLLIIGHQGILRVIYAYLIGAPREEAPNVPIPLHTVVKLTPQVYSCTEERFPLSSVTPSAEPISRSPEPEPEPEPVVEKQQELGEEEMNAPSC